MKHQHDRDDLRLFLDWLFSKRTQHEMGLHARSFQRSTQRFWDLWPPVPLVDEIHHVVHLDGIHLHRDAVVLVAVAGGHVIGVFCQVDLYGVVTFSGQFRRPFWTVWAVRFPIGVVWLFHQ